MSQANGTQSPVKTSQEAASTSEAPPEQALVPAQTQTDAPEQVCQALEQACRLHSPFHTPCSIQRNKGCVQNESKFAALFNQLGMQQQDPSSSRDQPKSRYAFWQTQPVPQFGAEAQVQSLNALDHAELLALHNTVVAPVGIEPTPTPKTAACLPGIQALQGLSCFWPVPALLGYRCGAPADSRSNAHNELQAGAADGPLDKEKSVSDVRQTPYDLPEG